MSALQTVQLDTDDERRLAGEASRALASHLALTLGASVRIEVAPGVGESVALPDGAVRLLQGVLENLSAGQRLTVANTEAEISTQEAADLLNVSRPYLVQLLERGEVPFRMVGTHRRVDVRDVLSWKQRNRESRKAVLNELAAEAQELGLGY